jgi:hypothetical protein
MECISCGRTDVLNRVVVNQLTRGEHGLLCADCEAEQFGAMLSEPAWHQDHGCAFCDGDGRFALPELDCLIERDDGSPRLLEHAPLEGAVPLCEAHVEELLPPESTITRRIEA